MEFRHLEYFLAVCEHPSITKAAESLYISQQALSRCIQGLETEFGCRLFKRTAQGSSLTDEGRYLYERFRPFSESYHQMAAEVTKHLQGLKKTITFASAPTIVSMLFPEVLYSFREKYPAFELEEQELPDWTNSGVMKGFSSSRSSPANCICVFTRTILWRPGTASPSRI